MASLRQEKPSGDGALARMQKELEELRAQQESKNQLWCTICHLAGHTPQSCPQKSYCHFCEKSGHEDKDCYYLKGLRQIQHQLIQQSGGSGNPAVPMATSYAYPQATPSQPTSHLVASYVQPALFPTYCSSSSSSLQPPTLTQSHGLCGRTNSNGLLHRPDILVLPPTVLSIDLSCAIDAGSMATIKEDVPYLKALHHATYVLRPEITTLGIVPNNAHLPPHHLQL